MIAGVLEKPEYVCAYGVKSNRTMNDEKLHVYSPFSRPISVRPIVANEMKQKKKCEREFMNVRGACQARRLRFCSSACVGDDAEKCES